MSYEIPESVQEQLARMDADRAAAADAGLPFCEVHRIAYEETPLDFFCPRCEAEKPPPPAPTLFEDTLFEVTENPQNGAVRFRVPGSEKIGRFMGDQPETSRQAAVALYRVSGAQRIAVLEALEAAGERGLTDDELAAETGALRARTRRQELIEEHDVPIRDSGKRRPSDAGHPAVVWILTT